ncbi:MAG: DUF2069 domain-containing protein [Rhodocyclaceae bacterium]|nr:DUF2069 domain-containing protein [Rhodocyclaceae bacterium]
MIRTTRLIASASLIGLIALCTAWELWLAPLRPGGSWLAMKALPLLLPLPGLLQGRRYTYQWASLLILAYLLEGMLRLLTDRGTMQMLAGLEALLSLVFFVAAILYARWSAAPRIVKTTAAD